MSATSRNPMPRVLIAADHVATRAGVRVALRGSECSEAENVDEAVVVAMRDRPDVCLIDFISPWRGIRAARRIIANMPGTPVVLMTPRIDEQEFMAAVHAGVSGYVDEDIDPARL